MIVWMLVGCAQPVDTAESVPEVLPAAPLAYALGAESIELGDVPVGTAQRAGVVLENRGDSDLTVVEIEVTGGLELHADVSPTRFVPPGGTTELVVDWAPNLVQTLATELVVTLGADGVASETLSVPVRGVGLGAVLAVSTVKYDFGTIGVGCEDDVTFTVSNSGNAELTIDSVDLEGDPAFSLAFGDDEQPPWTLGPFQSQSLTVAFAPTDLPSAAAVVEVVGSEGSASLVVSGSGAADAEKTLSYQASERGFATVLVHVNEVAIDGPWGTYSAQFAAGLPSFFETMANDGAQFRVAFLWNQNGIVDHATTFIDHTMSVDEATETALAMVANGGNAGDNDRSFTTLLAGIEQNRDWLFEDQWADGKLSLIAINRDTEQSGGSTSTYVASAQAEKADPEDVVFHAIGGPLPSGCGSAEAFQGYFDAVQMTGGVFLSVCEPDWSDHMAQLAAVTADGAGFFPLTGVPLVSSIAVRIDGVTQPLGWDYDPSLNAIVFEDEYYPSDGATVEVTYFESAGCA